MSSFAEHSCVSVKCSACGEGYEDIESGGEIHFATRADAAEAVEGASWKVDDDTALCRSCVREKECEANGHQWEEWRGCRCGCSIGAPKISDHTGLTEFRSCTHCDDNEFRPLPAEGGASS